MCKVGNNLGKWNAKDKKQQKVNDLQAQLNSEVAKASQANLNLRVRKYRRPQQTAWGAQN